MIDAIDPSAGRPVGFVVLEVNHDGDFLFQPAAYLEPIVRPQTILLDSSAADVPVVIRP